MFINKVSPSKIKVYDECKLKYKFKYIDYLPEKSKNTDALQFGSYVHKILEDGVHSTSVDELWNLAKSLRENYTFGEDKEKLLKPCVENFFRFNQSLSATEHVATEQTFAVDLKEGYAVNGIIDRVVKSSDGKYLVIDYKTSKRATTKRELYNDPQMLLYAFAVHKMYNVPVPNITLAHYYPHLDRLVNIKYSEAHVMMYIRKLTQKVWEIRKKKKTDFFPQMNQFCDWCGFKECCPKFNANHLVEYNKAVEERDQARKNKKMDV